MTRRCFLDEPTAGVDPVSRHDFWELIYTLAGRGVSVLATTHYMDEAEFCNVIGMMYRSRLIALNDPDSLKEAMNGVLFEIDCDEPAHAEKLLKKRDNIKDVAAHGVLMNVLVKDERYKMMLENTLQENGIKIARIERILPSLEDVFVSLVNQEKSDACSSRNRLRRYEAKFSPHNDHCSKRMDSYYQRSTYA